MLKEIQLGLADERITKELPQLRVVRRGKVVKLETADHNFTRVFLEKDAILLRVSQKEDPDRFFYVIRIPVPVMSVKYGSVWLAKQGRRVDALSNQRTLSKKIIRQIMPALREHTQLA